MYVYQNGKLYLQDGEKLVGVEVYSDKVLSIEGTETSLEDEALFLTPYEVRCKFQIDDTPYIFPKGEVENNESVKPVKRPPRKSTSK